MSRLQERWNRQTSRRRVVASFAMGLASLALAACGSTTAATTASASAAATTAPALSTMAAQSSAAPAATASAVPTTTAAASTTTTTTVATASTTASAAAAASTPAKNGVSLRFASYDLGPIPDKIAEDLSAAFTKEHPSITYKMEWSPGASYWEKLQSQVAGGTAPDLTINAIGWSIPGAVLGMFFDLNPLVDHDTIKRDDYFPTAWSTWTWHGKLWAGSAWLGSEVYWLNKDLLKGVAKLPTKDWTFDDLRTIASTVTNASGSGQAKQFGFHLGYSSIYAGLATLMLNFGGQVFNDSYSKALWGDDQNSIKGVQFVATMMFADKTVPTPDDIKGISDVFGEKHVAIEQNGTFKEGPFSKAIGDSLMVLPPPNGPGGSHSASGSNGWSILSSTKHTDEAYQVVRYQITEPGAKAWLPEGFPGLKQIAYTDWVKQAPNLDFATILDAVNKNSHTYYNTWDWLQWEAVADKTLSAIWTGAKSVPNAMKESADAVNAVFAKRPANVE